MDNRRMYAPLRPPSGYSPRAWAMIPVGLVGAALVTGFLGMTYARKKAEEVSQETLNLAYTSLHYLPAVPDAMRALESLVF